MGDQLGDAVEGELSYVDIEEVSKIINSSLDRYKRSKIFATIARINTLYMIARAGSGHIGSSFSSLDIVTWLYLEHMDEGDIYFSSKGHDAPGLYSVLLALGMLDQSLLHKLRRLGGLPGHPDVAFEGIAANTGSLGMGISKSKGMIRAARLRSKKTRVYVLLGDGELQEGQIWESLISVANNNMSELTIIVDNNKIQSDSRVTSVSDLGDIEGKFSSFGLEVVRCNGHDFRALESALILEGDRPRVVIADTVKGSGISFMEHTAMAEGQEWYQFHSGAPSKSDYHRAVSELVKKLEDDCRELGIATPNLRKVLPVPGPAVIGTKPQRLVDAYSQELVRRGEIDERIVVLDADLIRDTGVVAFRDKFPERFIECGIAEQDMVSQASGLALSGMFPIVHSFACFLSARPNEQIYNAATEKGKIMYVGSLAGLLPGGPGHSHQAVRDIAALSAIPNLVMIQPGNEEQTKDALGFACDDMRHSHYIRLSSIPVSFEADIVTRPLILGQGQLIASGNRPVAAVAYGPVLLNELMRANSVLKELTGKSITIFNMPFLNRIDKEWLSRTIANVDILLVLDDHYLDGGVGQMFGTALAEDGCPVRLIRRGLDQIPQSGLPEEVLMYHGLHRGDLLELLKEITS